MISRRKFVALLATLPVAGRAALASLLKSESKPVQRARKWDSDWPGYCVIVSCRGYLFRWLENPLAPRRSYGYVSWHTDDPENDLPVDVKTVECWRRILRKWAPSSYRRVLLDFARLRRDPEWCKARTGREWADVVEKRLLAAGWQRGGALTQI